MRQIKRAGGPITNDAQWYVNALGLYNQPVDAPFNTSMNGITYKSFYNTFGKGSGQFTDTNNLSLVVFIKYGGFKMLFPGDLERAGWLELLKRQDFRVELVGTNVLMASHHRRYSGFCEEVFDHFTPDCVVISEMAKAHNTQETVPDYRAVIHESGVVVRTTGKRRHVLTTRRDGWIRFDVDEQNYYIDTEYHG